jgi:histidinol dehydrogenase
MTMQIIYGAHEARRTILKRGSSIGEDPAAAENVRRIIADVRAEGDVAVRRYTERFDGPIAYPGLEVPREDIDAALGRIEPKLLGALEFAANRVRSYHQRQLERCLDSYVDDEGLGVQVRAIETVGFYAPGTQPAYPSSVLHTVVPAKVAGVENVIVVSPAAPDGRVPDVKLAAAAIAGADRIFCCSGAQAIAALAYGTQTVPRVDKIVGPGNIYVTLAKRAVYGDVGVDSIYGPTETVVVADFDADPAICAVDLLAQAEHDELAAPVFITCSAELAENVVAEVEERLAVLPRGAIARTALTHRGGFIVVDSIEEAVTLASEYAPEHLCILSKDARRLSTLVKNAGGIFIGDGSPEAIGDYTAGPSHVMPTGGAARFASPLSVQDFLKFSTIIDLDDNAVFDLGPPGAAIAHAEGLVAHARAIEERLPK